MRYPLIVCFGVVAAQVSAAPAILGFDTSRGGGFSLAAGNFVTGLHTEIVNGFPGVSFLSTSTVTEDSLAPAQIAIFMSAIAGNVAIAPLTANEQNALHAFVLSGGGAVLFTDNDTFAGSESSPANQSLLAPFGVASAGTGSGWERAADVAAPESSPVTSGPFGTVTAFSVGWTGWFSTTGNAKVLGRLRDNNQPAIVVYPRGALGPGSGRVVFFADCTMSANGFLTAANSAVIRNAIAYVSSGVCPGDLNDDGVVDDADFSLFVVAYDLLDCDDPAMAFGCPSDFNSDHVVDDSDFSIFAVAYNALVCP